MVMGEFLIGYFISCIGFLDGFFLVFIFCVVWSGGVLFYIFEWSIGFVEQDFFFLILENVLDNFVYSFMIIDVVGIIYSFVLIILNCGGIGNFVIVMIGEVVVNININFCVLVIVLGIVEVISFEVGVVWLLGIFSYIGVIGGVFGDVAIFIIDDSDLDIG